MSEAGEKATMPTSNNFAKSVLTMLSGTSVALAVALVASPLVSRIYSPEMFGQLAVFVSASSIGAIVATGRYELAIPIPRNRVTALGVAVIAIATSGSIALLGSVVLALLSWWAPGLLGTTLGPRLWIIAVPAGVFILASIQTLTYWQARRQAYGVVALARASQAIAMAGGQVGAGLLGLGGAGLIIGYLLGGLVSAWQLVHAGLKELRADFARLTRRWIRAAGWRYGDLPKYMVPGHLANALSSQLPVIMLAALYGPRQAGLYAFAERLVILPCAVVGNSVGEVFRQSAAQLYHHQGNCLDLFLRTKKRLALMAFAFAVAIMVLAPPMFPLVFGKAWREAGQLAISLGILVFFQGISSPLSQTVYLASMYRADLVWQFLRLLLSAAGLYLGFVLFRDFKISVLFHAIAFAISYMLHSSMQYIAARGGLHDKNPG